MRFPIAASALLLFLICGAPASPAADPASGVIFEETFEDEAYVERFTGASHASHRTLVEGGAVGSRALRFRVEEGGHYGGSLNYQFARAGLEEPEVLHARYHLRFAGDWEPGRGGKLPGPSGTYGRAGWGGRPSDGTNGWSARMGFRACDVHAGNTQLYFYTYHADMDGRYGSMFAWDRQGRGSLEPLRWYRIDIEVRMNTPGRNDGVLRGRVDGELAMERTDLRFRDVPELRIEQFWMNLYYGGSWTAPRDMHVDWDGVVLSSEPIPEP